MGTEVLYPQDFLADHINVSRCLYAHQTTRIGDRTTNFGSRRDIITLRSRIERRYCPTSITKGPSTSKNMETSTPNVEHHLKLTNRDRLLKGSQKNDRDNEEHLHISTTQRINIDPRISHNQKLTSSSNSESFQASSVGIYAGSTFLISPSPKSLPLPSFSPRMMDIHGSATRDLRRLLGLD